MAASPNSFSITAYLGCLAPDGGEDDGPQARAEVNFADLAKGNVAAALLPMLRSQDIVQEGSLPCAEESSQHLQFKR